MANKPKISELLRGVLIAFLEEEYSTKSATKQIDNATITLEGNIVTIKYADSTAVDVVKIVALQIS